MFKVIKFKLLFIKYLSKQSTLTKNSIEISTLCYAITAFLILIDRNLIEIVFPQKKMSIKIGQTCSFCKNHGVVAEKKGHKAQCPYLHENHWMLCTEGCQETRLRQISVAEDKKNKYRLSKGAQKQPAPEGKKRAAKTCSKCKNHDVHEVMNIRHMCQFAKCDCKACKITDKRRGHVKTDVTNIRRNQNTSTITPPRTPESLSSQGSSGSFSAQSSPSSGFVSDADAASPLRFDAETHEEFVHDASMLTPADSPADSGIQSPFHCWGSPEYDFFATTALPAMSPPSATLVQQDFEMSTLETELDSVFNEFRALPEPQNQTFFDLDMIELLDKASLELAALPETLQQEIQDVCMQSKENDCKAPKAFFLQFSFSFYQLWDSETTEVMSFRFN